MEYGHQDIQNYEPHYFKHVRAMTTESLHSKSDIAAELAWRDCEIESLRQQLTECQRAIQRLMLCDMAEVRAIEGSPDAIANARTVLAAMQGDKP